MNRLLLFSFVMSVDIELAAFASFVGKGGLVDIPDGWNGSVGSVNLSKPRDYSGDYGKWVGAGASLSLRDTLDRILWLAKGKPDDHLGATQEHLNVAVPHFRNAIAAYRIYRLFRECGVNPVFRVSDLVGTDFVADRAKDGDTAKGLYNMLTAAGVMEEKLAEVGRMKLFSIVANAIHREQHGDHSWFTQDMSKRRSPTAKIISIAGADSDKFRDYMTLHGHDGNHHLSFNSIASMASILCKETSAIFANNLDVGGTNLIGKELHEWLDLGESVTGRYPAGVLGKAALIIGLELVDAMVVNLATRVKLEGATQISVNADALVRQIKVANIPHSAILSVGQALGPMISVIFGFCVKAKVVDEDEYQAFANHAKRYPAKIAVGKSLATTLARTTPHAEAIGAAICTALASINEGIMAAASVKIAVGGDQEDLCGNVTAVDATKIAVEVGKTPASGAVFYDANE